MLGLGILSRLYGVTKHDVAVQKVKFFLNNLKCVFYPSRKPTTKPLFKPTRRKRGEKGDKGGKGGERGGKVGKWGKMGKKGGKGGKGGERLKKGGIGGKTG